MNPGILIDDCSRKEVEGHILKFLGGDVCIGVSLEFEYIGNLKMEENSGDESLTDMLIRKEKEL